MRHTGWGYPPPGDPRAFSPSPPKPFQGGGDAPLIGGADPRKLDFQRVSRDLQDGRFVLALEKALDFLFTRVGFVPRLLLRHDELAFETGVRPPAEALPIEVHGFGEKLIAVVGQTVDIDDADLDRPEPSAAGLVTQICRLIGRADENALARFDHLLAAVARAMALDGAGHERLEC